MKQNISTNAYGKIKELVDARQAINEIGNNKINKKGALPTIHHSFENNITFWMHFCHNVEKDWKRLNVRGKLQRRILATSCLPLLRIYWYIDSSHAHFKLGTVGAKVLQLDEYNYLSYHICWSNNFCINYGYFKVEKIPMHWTVITFSFRVDEVMIKRMIPRKFMLVVGLVETWRRYFEHSLFWLNWLIRWTDAYIKSAFVMRFRICNLRDNGARECFRKKIQILVQECDIYQCCVRS